MIKQIIRRLYACVTGFQTPVHPKFIKPVGHSSIVDKSSAYSAKGPGFKTQWRMKIYLCLCVFISRKRFDKLSVFG